MVSKNLYWDQLYNREWQVLIKIIKTDYLFINKFQV